MGVERRGHCWIHSGSSPYVYLTFEEDCSDLSLVVALHTRFAYRFANCIGFLKVVTLLFISITGLVVLSGKSKVQDPTANFRNALDGKASAYGVTNALYKIIFAYAGFENAFNVANEVKVSSAIPNL